MRNAHGQAEIFLPDGAIKTADTFTCGHCGSIKHLKPKEPPFATCKRCMRFICERCYGTGGCKPTEQWLAEQEAAIDRRLQWRRNLGAF